MVVKGSWASDSECFLLTNLFPEPRSQPSASPTWECGMGRALLLEEASGLSGNTENNHGGAGQRKTPSEPLSAVSPKAQALYPPS